jgi:hypothetical protein
MIRLGNSIADAAAIENRQLSIRSIRDGKSTYPGKSAGSPFSAAGNSS